MTAETDSSNGRALAQRLGAPYVEALSDYAASPEFLSTVPIAFARRHQILGMTNGSDALLLAIGDARSAEQIQIMSRHLRRQVKPVFAPSEVVLAAINHAYQQRSGQAEAYIQQLDRTEVL